MRKIKLIQNVWNWLKKHEIISNFFVTMFGVWAAFYLTGLSEQDSLDKTTEQLLHLTLLEAQYNGKIAIEILDGFSKKETMTVHIDRLSTISARMAYQNANIISFLPLHKISLLKSYIDATEILNKALDIYQRTIEISNYKQTSACDTIKQNVRSNAAAVVSNTIVLKEELEDYFDGQFYDHQSIKRIVKRIKFIKMKALKGEVFSSN